MMQEDRRRIYAVVELIRKGEEPTAFDALLPADLEETRQLLVTSLAIIRLMAAADEERIFASLLRAADRFERKPES
jgi:hypothetical protein